MLTTKELPTNLTDKFWLGEGGPYHPWGETQHFLDGWAGLNVGMTPSWGRVPPYCAALHPQLFT